MSLLSDYEQRTAWKYEPMGGFFHTAKGLENKMNPDGSYAEFTGSTVVFRTGVQEMQMIHLMQRLLHHKLDDTGMLAEQLPQTTIHMTLHDLICPELCSSEASDSGQYRREVADSLGRAEEIVEEIRKDYAGVKVRMVADRIVNMVSKSIVLLLRPQTEEDYKTLLEMYERFNRVQNLPYPLTPHITLAYFKPGMIDGDRLWEALNFAQIHPENAPVFEFDTEGITAQRFLDMKTYVDIPERICFCCDGGLNRSVMAANILNHLAEEKRLPLCAEARAAYPNTEGWMIPEKTRETLASHGIQMDKSYAAARYLMENEAAHFTCFAPISLGAGNRLRMIGLPREKIEEMFLGVRDPAYEGISHEEAFRELYQRVEKFLDDKYGTA